MQAGTAQSLREDLEAVRQVNAGMKAAMRSEMDKTQREADERVDALRKLANATGQELESTTALHRKATRRADTAEARVTKLEEELETQRKQLQQVQNECDSLKAEGCAAQTREAAATARADSVQDDLAKLRLQLDSMAAEHKAAQAAAAAAEGTVASLRAELEDARAAAASAQGPADAANPQASRGGGEGDDSGDAAEVDGAPVAPSPMRTTSAVVRHELEATAAQLAKVTQELAACREELATAREEGTRRLAEESARVGALETELVRTSSASVWGAGVWRGTCLTVLVPARRRCDPHMSRRPTACGNVWTKLLTIATPPSRAPRPPKHEHGSCRRR